MKTIITLAMALIVSVCAGQENEQISNEFISVEHVEQIKEVLTTLSEKLNNAKSPLIHKDDVYHIIHTLKGVHGEMEDKTVFTKVIKRECSPTSSTEIKYTITINSDEDYKHIEALEHVDFVALKEAMKELLVTMQESPLLKELAESLKDLESDLKAKKD